MALGGALLIDTLHLRNITLFLCAIAVAAWYGGTEAAALALKEGKKTGFSALVE